MANPLKGEVAFTADGRDLVLCFDVNRLCELESLLDQPASDLLPKVGQGVMIVMRGFMWAGLRGYEMTLVEAGQVVQDVTPLKAAALIFDAMRKAFPTSGGDGTANPPKA